MPGERSGKSGGGAEMRTHSTSSVSYFQTCVHALFDLRLAFFREHSGRYSHAWNIISNATLKKVAVARYVERNNTPL